MGCDIHFYVEEKTDGSWGYSPPPPRRCDDCDGTGKNVDKTGNSRKEWVGQLCYWCKGSGKSRRPLYDGRNYDLFAMLADVRNGRGFAGCRTGEGFAPIAAPKGLPEDASPEVADWAEGRDVDGHSHSYLTLTELLAYDWERVSEKQGVVSLEEYMRWVDGGRKWPESWSGGVSGGAVVNVSNAEMDKLIAKGVRTPTDWGSPHYYTTITWKAVYKDSARDFYDKTIPALKAIADRVGGPDNVRIVFWFDN